MTLLAITRVDVADYVNTLLLVYMVLIFVRILLIVDPAHPLQPLCSTRSCSFVTDVTDPYLNLFRRFLPPVRMGPGALDLSPIVAIFVLIIVGRDRRQPDPRLLTAVQPALPRAGLTARRRGRARPGRRRRSCADSIAPGEPRGPVPRPRPHQRAQHGRGVRGARGRRARRGGADRRVAGAAGRLLRGATATCRGCGCRWACCSAARSATCSTGRARARSSTSSTRSPGRPSTWPTAASWSACSCCSTWSRGAHGRTTAWT